MTLSYMGRLYSDHGHTPIKKDFLLRNTCWRYSWEMLSNTWRGADPPEFVGRNCEKKIDNSLEPMPLPVHARSVLPAHTPMSP